MKEKTDCSVQHVVPAGNCAGGSGLPVPERAVPAGGAGSTETVKRMDCPTVMREHLWSLKNNGWVECLWCCERRLVSHVEEPAPGGNAKSSDGGRQP